ncbi:hypothetical protein [Actinomadura sp. 6N118]|uniref:hypothetical protein n=1 Tax=Actinomadura sp. 6N118 TaxID=3375151 RepID=UPI003797F480
MRMERDERRAERAARSVEAPPETSLIPPDSPLLAWGVFAGDEEAAAYRSCAAAITAGDLRVGERGLEKARARVVEEHLVSPRPGGTWLERVQAERLDTWTQPRNQRKALLCRAAVGQLREPIALAPDAFPLLRWLLDKAVDGLPLTDRHYISPRLVTEAVELFGWRADLVGTLTREFDVFPLQSIRELATREMKAVRRSGKRLVLTPSGRRMREDQALLWQTAVASIIGQGHLFTVTAREIMLALLIVNGPTPAEKLQHQVIEIMDGEWGAPGGIAGSVRDEYYALRHRLWALDCHRPARPFDAPFALTSTGITAVKAAVRAYAVRPHSSLGRG